MKRSVRDYLLTLCLAVVIFTVVAFFLIQAAEGLMGDVVGKIGSDGESETLTQEEVSTSPAPAPAPDPAPQPQTPEKQEDVVVTFLIMGLDETEKKADSIFLLGINQTKKQVTMSLIPSNTVVPEGNKKYQLGELYASRSMNFFQEFIAQETGIMADYYACVSLSAISNLVDFLGGISFQVPQDMYLLDEANNKKIDLKAGNQTLSGDGVVQMLSFDNYTGGRTAKENTQLNFAKAFCTTFLRPENISRFKSIMFNISHNIKTDFEEVDLNQNAEIIFNFPAYSQSFIRIPGAATGEVYYAISTSRAKSTFEIYQ